MAMSGTRANKRAAQRRSNPAAGYSVLSGLLRCARNDDTVRLRLGKIQLHADAVGIVHEKLRIAGTRHDALAEFYAFGLQAPAHAVDIARGKRDMVEAA